MTDLNRAQRVVLVVAAGVALLAIGQWLTSVIESRVPIVGWTGYAPLETVVRGSRGQRVELLLMWLGLVAVWAISALVLLRTSRTRRPPSASPHDAVDRRTDVDLGG